LWTLKILIPAELKIVRMSLMLTRNPWLSLLITLLLVACPGSPANNTSGDGSLSVVTGSVANVTGRWNATIYKSTGEINPAIMTLTQATDSSKFTGVMYFTSFFISDVPLSILGDVQTGEFKIKETYGSVHVDVSGQFTNNSYSGSYVAHYSDGTANTGKIFMTKAPPTSKLTFTVNGLNFESAPITILEKQKVVFSGPVANGTIVELPKALLTIKTQDTETSLAPEPQTIDLSTGDKVITLNFRERPLRLSVYENSLEIYRKARASIKAQLIPASNFVGTVEVRLKNLPAGVQQLAPVDIAVNGKPVAVEVSITSAVDTKLVDAEVILVVTSGVDSATTKINLQTKPELISPIPDNSRYSWTVALDGNLYVTSPGEEAIFRINSDGSRELIVRGAFSWADELKAGSDGSLWVMRSQPIRIDPISKTQETYPCPASLSCYSFGIIIDSKKRAWDGHFELKRTDLLTGQVVNIPEAKGKDYIQRSQIIGDTFWGVYEKTIIAINTDTLAVKTYNFPEFSSIYNFFISGDTISLTATSSSSISSPPQIYLFNVKTGLLTPHPLENTYQAQIIGQDSNGIFWVMSDRKWLRYDPKNKAVLEKLPLLAWGAKVTPNGDIWCFTEKGFFFVAR
jgi:hypothetical protein